MINTILISGKGGAGKTTLAGYLAKELGAKIFKFADPIYEHHQKFWDMLRAEGLPFPEKSISRRLLQTIGTEVGRDEAHQHVWCLILQKRLIAYREQAGENAVVIIDDLRFKNEFDLIPGYKIRLDCPQSVRKARAGKWDDKTVDHLSEIDLDDYASQGSFDLTVDTSEHPAKSMAKIRAYLRDLYIAKDLVNIKFEI